MRSVVCLILFIIGIGQVLADIVVSGRVTDSTGQPLPALISILSNEKVVGFGLANEEGNYSITLSTANDSVKVKVALLGFETKEIYVSAKTQKLDFTLLESSKKLEEVVVVADKITQRGDTLTYLAGAYADKSDRVIGDVIKKMPGLEVSESGRISFNGKTVKNFYVEDMDLLEGRYGIATNNISASDVAAVQVYQNHQPIRALQEWNPSDDVTINIRLKSSARGTFSLNGMAGAGYRPIMWAAEAVAMYFGKKGQSMTTYKGNNSGDNVTAEQSNLTGNGPMQFFNSAPLSVVTPGSPGVALKRYLNNRSNTVSTNNILKVDSFTTVNLSVAYLNDIIRNSGMSSTEQYLPAGDYRWISQKISSKSYVNNLNGSTTFKKNLPSLYLANTLNFNTGWNKDRGNSVTSASFMNSVEDVGQFLDNLSFTIDDKLSIITNQGSRAWQLNAALGWNHRPQSLTVSPATMFGQSNATDEICQDYTTDDFRAEVQTGLNYKLGAVIINTLAFGNIDVESVSSQLIGFNSESIPNNANDYTFGKGEAGIEPRFGYGIKELYVELRLPVSYNAQWLRDKVDGQRDQDWNYLNFMPACKITYRFGKSWWEFNTSFYRIRDNSGRVAPGIVMTDYLSFRQYLIEKTLVDKTWYTTFGYNYSNAMSQLFGNASLSWLRSNQNSMTGYEYDGLVTIRNVYDLPYVSNRYTATVNINKGIGFWESTMKLGGNYSLNTSKQVINQDLFDYKTQYWSTNIMFATTPATWMGAALGFAYGENRSFTELTKAEALTIRQYTGRLDLNFFPVPRFVVNLAVEDNYTNLTSGLRHSWFGDLKLKYKFMRCDVEFEFNNIFNRRQFTRVNYNDMNISRSTYELRPRNVMLKVRFNIL